MWDVTCPSKRWNSELPLEIIKVLYEFDGPLIFVAQFGAVTGFFLKISQSNGSNIFLVSQVREGLVDRISRGELAVRAAFERDFYWIVDLREDMCVPRYWECESTHLPSKYLPRRNIPLHPYMRAAPNSLEQADAFFAVDFQGTTLKRTGIRFSTFKSLINNTYDAMRAILSPTELLGTRTSTFDFVLDEPVFGSLIISVQQPTINIQNTQKRSGLEFMDEADIRKQFHNQRQVFFDEMEDVVYKAENSQISTAMADEKFILFDKLQHIIPTEENDLKSVMFSAAAGNRFDHVLVSERAGNVINNAFREATTRPIEEIGKVQVINDPSRSFVIMSQRGKQVTCYVGDNHFINLRKDPRFRNGVLLKLKGNLQRRPRRDELYAVGEPTLIK